MPEIQTVRYTHDALIDMIVARPDISQGALADMFGYTQSWVSTIMASDAFKERLAARREELIDPILLTTAKDRLEALTIRSLEVLQEKLAAPVALVSDDLALRAAALGAKGVFAQKVEAQVNVKGSVVQMTPETLAQLTPDELESISKVLDKL